MANWAHLALTLGDITHPGLHRPAHARRPQLHVGHATSPASSAAPTRCSPRSHALTGDAKHLETAKCFDNRESLFDACVENRDILVCAPGTQPGRRRPARLHANTHVPQFIGYMRIFERTGEREYRTGREELLRHGRPAPDVRPRRHERQLPRARTTTPSCSRTATTSPTRSPPNGAETCTTYNLLKLARNLFFHEHDPAYMDYYERGLVNQIAGSRADNDDDVATRRSRTSSR